MNISASYKMVELLEQGDNTQKFSRSRRRRRRGVAAARTEIEMLPLQEIVSLSEALEQPKWTDRRRCSLRQACASKDGEISARCV